MCLIFCVWAPKCCNKDVVLLHNLLICFLNLSFRFMQMFSLQLCKISDGCRYKKQDHKCVHKQNASAMLTWKPELTVPTSSLLLHSWLISIWFLTYLFKVQQVYSLVLLSIYEFLHSIWNGTSDVISPTPSVLESTQKETADNTLPHSEMSLGLTDRHCAVSTIAVVKAPWNKDILFIFVWHLAW